MWQIDSQYPQARLSIGSAAAAGWPINAFGVQPNHFEIYWDGNTLYLADTLRVGGVTLNGQPLGAEWVQIRGRGEVVFGQASMSIETSESNARPIQTDPSIAKRVSVTPDMGTQEIQAEATRVAEPSWSDADALAAESTRIGDETMMPSMMGAPSLGRPPAPQLGARPASQYPPAPPPGARPRLGGSPGGGMREQAPTLMGGLSPQEATRMVSLDDVPASVVVAPGAGAPQFGGPQFGAPPGGGFGAPPPAFGSAPSGGPGGAFSPTTPPNAPAAGGFAMPGAPGASTATGGFAPPPMAAPANAGASIKDALGKVPRRTLVMAGGALLVALVAVAFLFSGEPDPPPPGPLAPPYVPIATVPTTAVPGAPEGVGVAPVAVAPVAVAPVGVAPVAVAPVAVAPVAVAPVAVAPVAVAPVDVAPVAVAPVDVAPVDVAPVGVAPIAPVAAVPGVEPVIDPSIPTDDRRAADLAIAGRFAEALPIYQALALAHPDQPEYGMMVRMLERRITSANCINGLTPDGRSCTAGAY